MALYLNLDSNDFVPHVIIIKLNWRQITIQHNGKNTISYKFWLYSEKYYFDFINTHISLFYAGLFRLLIFLETNTIF